MAIGDLITTDYEIEYNGLLTGAETDFALISASGLADMPDVRASDRGRIQRHGVHPGDDWLGRRAFILTYELYSSTNDFSGMLDTFKQAFSTSNSETTLALQIPGVAAGNKVQIDCRPRRMSLPINLEWLYGIPIATVELVATDPRFYANAATTVSGVALGATSSGLTWPLTWPLTWGTTESGTFQATNDGNTNVWPTFTITGPVTGPRIENTTQERTLDFDLTVAAGDTLEIDTNARTVLLNGTASRYSALRPSSSWFGFAPGTDSVRFAGQSGTGTLSASWRSGWI